MPLKCTARQRGGGGGEESEQRQLPLQQCLHMMAVDVQLGLRGRTVHPKGGGGARKGHSGRIQIDVARAPPLRQPLNIQAVCWTFLCSNRNITLLYAAVAVLSMQIIYCESLGTYMHVQADANFEIFSLLIEAGHCLQRVMKFGKLQTTSVSCIRMYECACQSKRPLMRSTGPISLQPNADMSV